MRVEIRGVDNILLPVSELAAAKEFYLGTLGLALKFEVPDHGVALFTPGNDPEGPGLLVRTHPQAGRGIPPAMRVWLEVPDARAAAAELAARGVEPLADPFRIATGWTVEIEDPWGNVIGLTDYTGR
jgi:predicted enzyme related to lactoylglutathione lyase